MKYYGVRYGKKCNPTDLWKTYFTSSNKVTEYRNEYGEPDIIQIRRTFLGENKVNSAREWEHKVLTKLDVVGRQDYLNNGNGKGIDPRVSSLARTGVSPGNKGKPQAEYIKNKKRKPKPIVTCPKCNKSGGISAMFRHHFDNCGKKQDSSTISLLRKSNHNKSSRQLVTDLLTIKKSLTQRRWRYICTQFQLKPGWYQLSDEWLSAKISEINDYLSSLNHLNLGNLRECVPS
jgi:hypothetical protein